MIAAILALVAIVAKLVTANLITKAHRRYAALDAQRRSMAMQLKEEMAKHKSAAGTLDFWSRRREEAGRQVADTRLDLQEYTRRTEVDAEDTAGEDAELQSADSRSDAPEATGGGSGVDQEGTVPAADPAT
ncbi:MAG: hypothetical protein ABIL09_18090 [Gemmatimonadota bacterium]